METVAFIFLMGSFCFIMGFIIGQLTYKTRSKKITDTFFGKNINFTPEEQFTDVSEIDFGKKSLSPQSTWKPSDEHMNALNYVVNLMASSERPTENDLYYNILKSLRQQLKKVKG